jgi:hypothetical protein
MPRGGSVGLYPECQTTAPLFAVFGKGAFWRWSWSWGGWGVREATIGRRCVGIGCRVFVTTLGGLAIAIWKVLKCHSNLIAGSASKFQVGE